MNSASRVSNAASLSLQNCSSCWCSFLACSSESRNIASRSVHISSLNLRARPASLKPTKSSGFLDQSESLSLKHVCGGGGKIGGASRGGGGGTGASGGGGGRDTSTLVDVGGGGALTEGGEGVLILESKGGGALDIGGASGAPTTAEHGGVYEMSDCLLGA